MALPEDIENFTTTVEDAVSYPILTRETSDYPYSRNGSSSSSGNGITATTRTAKQTIRDVLGWRYRSDDAKGFLAALNKSFSLTEVEGHVEWEWKAQSYMVQADMGEITGAQASVYKQATVALENALPLLDGLTPLRTDADKEDTEAMRAIIRTEMTELVGELGIVGGPRVQRVDSFFEKLIGPLMPTPNFDPEKVKGQLARVRHRFGLVRARVNTITEEQNLTNFLILVDYVNSLYQSWNSKRGFFDGTEEPFLGTQLVLLSEILDAILEQLQETYDAMDSVFFGPAERQTTEIDLGPGRGSMTVTEILSWVENFAAVEGRQLIQEGGKDGVVVFHSTIARLRQIVRTAARISARISTNPVRPFHTRRVALALDELATYLTSAEKRASEIRRRTLEVTEHLSKEENVVLEPTLISSQRMTAVYYVEVAEKQTAKGWSPVTAEDAISAGDQVKLILRGFFPFQPVALYFDEDISVQKIHDASERQVVAIVKVKKGNPKIGWHDLQVQDCERQSVSVPQALYVSAGLPEAKGGEIDAKFEPCCGRQGQEKLVRFTFGKPEDHASSEAAERYFTGAGLAGAGVCFGSGHNITVRSAIFSEHGMHVKIAIGDHARIGDYDVMLFTADGRSAMLKKKFEVLAAVSGPLYNVGCIPVTPPTDECPDETPYGQTTPAMFPDEAPLTSTNAPHEQGNQSAGYTPLAADSPTKDYVPPSYGPTVTAALKLAKMKFEEVTGEHHQTLNKPFRLEKAGNRRIEFDLAGKHDVATAWLIPRNAKGGIKCTFIQKGKHITVEPTEWGRGSYEVVVIKKNKSVEALKNAAILN